MFEIWDDLRIWLSLRRSRMSYLKFHTGLLVVFVPVAIVAAFIGLIWLAYPVALVLSLVSVAAVVQRCHDCNFPGWPVVVLYLFDGVLRVVEVPDESAAANWLSVPTFLGTVIFIALLFIPGTRGPNRYGADPGEFQASTAVEPTVWKQ
jgi:uncharacterized membrane protein YhaH (DUF805 family)